MTTAPAAATPESSRIRAVLLLLFVFILGAVCGIGGSLLAVRRASQRAFSGASTGAAPAEFVASMLEKQISSELKLTPAEREAAHRELAVSVHQFTELRAHFRSDARTLVDDTLTRISAQLPPEKAGQLRESAAKRLRPWGLMP